MNPYESPAEVEEVKGAPLWSTLFFGCFILFYVFLIILFPVLAYVEINKQSGRLLEILAAVTIGETLCLFGIPIGLIGMYTKDES